MRKIQGEYEVVGRDVKVLSVLVLGKRPISAAMPHQGLPYL